MKNKMFFIALTLMFFIGSISITSAQVIKIGTGENPAIYGSKVAWSDTTSSIHVYDLTTKKDIKVTSSKASYPAIYGNKLVWHDESSRTPRLTVYDILSGARSYITQNVDSTSIPKIYGNRIVWSANYNESNYNYNVYMRDISASKQTKIADGDSPDIYDTKITYTYDSGDMPRVYIYDVISNKTLPASPYSGYLSNPHIYGKKVIWSDFYTRSGHISIYDIATKNTIDLIGDDAYIDNPNDPYAGKDAGEDTGTHANIYGDKIVYEKLGDDRYGTAGVYVYSISTGHSTQVFKYVDALAPAIYGNTIAWGIDSNIGGNEINDYGIYVSDLVAKPVASFTTDPVLGTHPLIITFMYKGTGGGIPDSYLWNFGDKTTSTHTLTATHTYSKAGVYTVSLTVKNKAGSSTSTKSKYITVK